MKKMKKMKIIIMKRGGWRRHSRWGGGSRGGRGGAWRRRWWGWRSACLWRCPLWSGWTADTCPCRSPRWVARRRRREKIAMWWRGREKMETLLWCLKKTKKWMSSEKWVMKFKEVERTCFITPFQITCVLFQNRHTFEKPVKIYN